MKTRPRGFTLIEMLATLALASLLMLGILSVMASLGKARQEVESHRSEVPLAADVEAVILRDLQDARSVKAEGAGFRIEGYGAMDPKTLARTHRPARVVYSVRNGGGGGVLVRQQWTFDDESGAKSFSQIVALNVGQFALKDIQWPKHAHLVIQPSAVGGPSVDSIVHLE
jgi:prepilin-type N-terminal cleavage/methylation domain-containing protein